MCYLVLAETASSAKTSQVCFPPQLVEALTISLSHSCFMFLVQNLIASGQNLLMERKERA